MKRNLLFLCALLCSAMASAQTYKNVYSAKQDWSRIYDFNKFDDAVAPYNGLAIDDSGGIYITGTFIKDSSYTTGLLCNKYSPDGKIIWAALNGAGMTAGNAIMWDSVEQRIYNCGFENGPLGGVGLSSEFDFYMLQANGNFDGEYSFPNLNATKRQPHYAEALNMCEDKNGVVYVTGYISGYLSYGALNHNLLTTFKVQGSDTYDGIKWMSSYDSTNLLAEEGQFIAVDPSKNVYVAGIRADSVHYKQSFSLLCVKYDSSGNIKWQRKFINNDTFYLTSASGLAVSNSGSAYMCGNIPNKGAQSTDGIILKYTNQGKLAWQKRMSSLLLHTQDAACNGLALNKKGELYAIGYIDNDSGEYATLIKMDSAGKMLWMDTLQDPYNTIIYTEAVALTLDDTGNVYVTGSRGGNNQAFEDVYTARYDSAGHRQWYIRYNDSLPSYNSPTAIALDKKGNVIVAGGHNGDTTTGEDILVLKYSQSMTKVRVHNSDISNGQPLSSGITVFPNPFSDRLNGEISLPEVSSVALDFYDITGRSVKTINYNGLPTGSNNIEIGTGDLAKGLYFYKCMIINAAGASTQNGKVVKQ